MAEAPPRNISFPFDLLLGIQRLDERFDASRLHFEFNLGDFGEDLLDDRRKWGSEPHVVHGKNSLRVQLWNGPHNGIPSHVRVSRNGSGETINLCVPGSLSPYRTSDVRSCSL